ncbi:MAG TPA: hypothetical protein VMV94_04385 [Phycisphaerae bacterium]|nr:hypothetical protein [Phycisphaerae bacterium]
MVLSIISLLMVVLVTAFWVYQGLFSAMIMLFETITACMLAFGFHEAVQSLWGSSETMRDIGPGLSMMLIFLISLVAMRVATDKLVPDAVVFPLQLDRAGAGVCGFFTGMILVGTALVAVQMLPFETSVLGFERVQVDRDGVFSRKSLLLNPDGFTVGLASFLSNGRFGGGNPLGEAKPDFLLDLWAARSGPREAGRDVPANCLSVKGYWRADKINRLEQSAVGPELKRSFAPQEPGPSEKFLACRVQLDGSAAWPTEKGEIRFRVSQFRIVGARAVEGRTAGTGEEFMACGMSDLYTHKDYKWTEIKPDQPDRLVRFSPRTDFLLSATAAKVIQKDGGRYQFDVVFEVPEDFEPWYVEFKRGARAELTKNLQLKEAPGSIAGAGATAEKPAKGAKQGKAEGEEKAAEEEKKVEVGAAPAGRTHVADAIQERTGVTDELPMILAKDSYAKKFLRGDKLAAGQFYVEMPDKEIPEDQQIKKFDVPKDKRMVQVGAEQNIPVNLLATALNYAAKVTSQPRITTTDGTAYFAIGVYSAAKVNGKMTFEVQYWPEAETPERCLKEPKKVTANVMKAAKPDERKFGYIFLVDPGVEIASFTAGGKGEGQTLKIAVPG